MVGFDPQAWVRPKHWAISAICGAWFVLAVGTCSAQDVPILLDTSQALLARDLQPGGRLGRLRFLGMLALPTFKVNGLRFSQLSGLAWDDDDGILYTLSDKGALFHLQPIIKNGVLVGLKLLQAVPLRELDTRQPLKWQRVDAEGMEIHNGRNGRRGDAELIIGFERHPRIVRYRPNGYAKREHPLPAPLRDIKAYRSNNKALETVCEDNRYGLLTVPEVPLKDERPGLARIFSLSGKSWYYPFAEGNRIAALECLGGGRLLLLEGDFPGFFGRGTISLRRTVLTNAPEPGIPLKVETLVTLDAAKGHEIDNFEGLTRHRDNRFFLVSDDNDLFVQRTLLLYFEVLEN